MLGAIGVEASNPLVDHFPTHDLDGHVVEPRAELAEDGPIRARVAVVVHATMSLANDPLTDLDWAPPAAGSSPDLAARAADLVRVTGAWAVDHVTELRTMLRLSLAPERQPEESRRGMTHRGRRIDAVLEGLPRDVPQAARDPLAAALIPLFGSDAVVWTSDMAHLSRDEAIELLAWMAQALVAATLA